MIAKITVKVGRHEVIVPGRRLRDSVATGRNHKKVGHGRITGGRWKTEAGVLIWSKNLRDAFLAGKEFEHFASVIFACGGIGEIDQSRPAFRDDLHASAGNLPGWAH